MKYNTTTGYVTNNTSTDITGVGINDLINDLNTSIYNDLNTSIYKEGNGFNFGDLFNDNTRRPIKTSSGVGAALAEMINGDIKKQS